MAPYGESNGEQGGFVLLYLLVVAFHGILAMFVLPDYVPASVEPGIASFFLAVVVFLWFYVSGVFGTRFLSRTDDGHYYAVGGFVNLVVGILIWGGYMGLRAIWNNAGPIQMNGALWMGVLAIAALFVLCAYSSITDS